eukprot:5198403-Prymnesium_polylepis.1
MGARGGEHTRRRGCHMRESGRQHTRGSEVPCEGGRGLTQLAVCRRQQLVHGRGDGVKLPRGRELVERLRRTLDRVGRERLPYL